MKMRNILYLLGMLLLGACSKYEDGPFMFIGNAKERLYGTYKVTCFSKNGEDLTQHWKDSCDWTFKFYDESFTPEVEDYFAFNGKVFVDNEFKQIWNEFSGFELLDKNRSLRLGFSSYYESNRINNDTVGIFPFSTGIGAVRVFKIRRFKEKEIWLGYEEGEDKYLIKLEE